MIHSSFVMDSHQTLSLAGAELPPLNSFVSPVFIVKGGTGRTEDARPSVTSPPPPPLLAARWVGLWERAAHQRMCAEAASQGCGAACLAGCGL